MSMLDEIKNRLDKATSSPWQTRFIYRLFVSARADPEMEFNTKRDQDWKDSDFIANAPSDIDWLIEAVEKLESRLDRTEYWYSTRIKRIQQFFKGKPEYSDVCCIIANGTATPGENPTYAQILNRKNYEIKELKKKIHDLSRVYECSKNP